MPFPPQSINPMRLNDFVVNFATPKSFDSYQIGSYFCRGIGTGNLKLYWKSGVGTARLLLAKTPGENPIIEPATYPTFFEPHVNCWRAKILHSSSAGKGKII